MKTRDRQKGFLTIIAILLVVIIAFIVVTASYQFGTDTVSTYSQLKGAQSFYASQSGLSAGKHDITSGLSCSGYDSGIITVTLSNGVTGQYQTTGTTSSAVSALPGGGCTGELCDDDSGDDNQYYGGNHWGSWNTGGSWSKGGWHGNGYSHHGDDDDNGWRHGGHSWSDNGGGYRWSGGDNSYDHGNGWGEQGHCGWGHDDGNHNSGGITATATTITLVSTVGFTVPGAVTIDNEIITYTGISGNTLVGVVRGVNGTTAVSHSAGAIVQQNQCFLVTTSGVPTLSTGSSGRVLRLLLIGTSFGFNLNGSYTIPTSTTGGNYTLAGDATVLNPTVTLNGAGFTGANIISDGTVTWTTGSGNSPQTQIGSSTNVSTGSGSNQKADVQANTPLYSSSTFYSQYFPESLELTKTDAITDGTYYASGSSISGLSGQVIFYDGSLSLSSGTIGNASNPVLLIVNGNLTLSGTAKITGFVYVVGTSTLGGNAKITGALAGQGNVALSSSVTLTLSQSVLNKVNVMSGNQNVKYNANPVTSQEDLR